MRPVEQQIQAYAQLLDHAVAPVVPDDVITSTLPPARRRSPRLAFAAVLLVLALAGGAVVFARANRDDPGRVGATATPSPTAAIAGVESSIQATSLGSQAPAPIAGVVTDAARWQELWAPQTPPAVDFARDVAFVIDTNAFCDRVSDVHLVGDQLEPVWLADPPLCPYSPTRWTIAVGRDALPSPVTFAPRDEISLRVALDPGASALVTTEQPAGHQPACVIHAGVEGGPAPSATITVREGLTLPVNGGDPAQRLDDVTLDRDGATDIGTSPQGAATVLWGSVTNGGPFAGLDQTPIGATITLTQPDTSCTQQWRVVAVSTAGADLSATPAATARPALTLIGFDAGSTSGAGPDPLFSVVAEPS